MEVVATVEWAVASTNIISICKAQMRYSRISSVAKTHLLTSSMTMMISLAEDSVDSLAALEAAWEAWATEVKKRKSKDKIHLKIWASEEALEKWV